jgi:hypothetical protein
VQVAGASTTLPVRTTPMELLTARAGLDESSQIVWPELVRRKPEPHNPKPARQGFDVGTAQACHVTRNLHNSPFYMCSLALRQTRTTFPTYEANLESLQTQGSLFRDKHTIPALRRKMNPEH